jgi:hypothetical protein
MNKKQIKTECDLLNTKIKFFNAQRDYLTTALEEVQCNLESIKSNICFFQFKTHEEAQDLIAGVLEDKASNDCEGSYCYGQSEYTQEYQLIDSDVVYEGKIKVEYNRHAKTYYYVDEVEYSFSEVKCNAN